jgi:hypothetical protein
MYQIIDKINNVKQAVQQLKEIFQTPGLEKIEVEYDNYEDDSFINLNINEVKINDTVHVSEDFYYDVREIEDEILDKAQLEKLSYVLNIFLSSDEENETETLVITKDDINCFNLI